MSQGIADPSVSDVDTGTSQVSVKELMSVVHNSEYRDRAASLDPSSSAIRGQQDFLRVPNRTETRPNGSAKVSFQCTHSSKSLDDDTQHDHGNGHPPPSIGTDSICDDYGISQHQLNRESSAPVEDEVDRVSTEDTLRGLADEGVIPPHIAAAERKRLQSSLIKALVRQNDGREFLPLAKLDELVTRKVVERQLRGVFGSPSGQPDIQTCVEYVCNRKYVEGAKHLKFTSARRLFALLIMIEKLETFNDLRNSDLCDIDLPLKGLDEAPKSALRDKVFSCFQSWSTFNLRSFEEWQWKLLAPYFSTAEDPKEKVLFYRLAPQTVMPWIEEKTPEVEHYGGQSWVKKVKIHESHHNFKGLEGRDSYFAVKKLHSRNEKDFKVEVDALKRFSNRPDSNLVRLLATYQHQDNYCLLFPWADGNLRDLWEAVESPMSQPSQEGAIWMARVCHGIASGLAKVHTHITTEEMSQSISALTNQKANAIFSEADTPGDEMAFSDGENYSRQRFGRHGDLKPENILWFKDPDVICPHKMGVLKISDFGLTRFHSRRSVSERESQRTAGFSNTYRAPEIDLKTGINQRYDIWTLGCLYLEFITWFMGGGEVVEEVSVRRLDEDKLIKDPDWIPEDNFFKLTHGSTRACLKDNVRKVSPPQSPD